MEFDKVLNKRRSIRRYTQKDVKQEDIDEIIEAGLKAPSAGNLQPWRFIVTDNKEKINQAVDTTYIGGNIDSDKNQDWIREVPVIILACIDYTDPVNKYGEHGKKAAIQDVSAAVENMVLKIVDLGLASCWISGFREKELKKVFEVPDHIDILAFLPIGYDDGYNRKISKKDKNEVVFMDVYGKKVK